MCNVLSLVVNGQDANSFKLVRQKDNTYLVEWFATCSPFGTNHLQMKLYVMLGRYSTTNIIGEPRAEFNGNQLQWDSETTGFFRNLTEFNAHLQVSSADYRIAILDENSNQIDQIHGHTDNHEISERWISGVSEKFKGSNQELSAIIYVTPATAASNGVANTNPATECFSYP